MIDGSCKVDRTIEGALTVESINLFYGAGLVLASLAVLKGVQAIAEHYFPNSEGVVAARFILGGP